jgi:hypothetical protein
MATRFNVVIVFCRVSGHQLVSSTKSPDATETNAIHIVSYRVHNKTETNHRYVKTDDK